MSELTVEEWSRTNRQASGAAGRPSGTAADAGDGRGEGPAGAARDGRGEGPAEDAAVAAVRGFNRFYTNVIGLLRGKYLDTPYSLTEARLLFELAQRDSSEVTDLR